MNINAVRIPNHAVREVTISPASETQLRVEMRFQPATDGPEESVAISVVLDANDRTVYALQRAAARRAIELLEQLVAAPRQPT